MAGTGKNCFDYIADKPNNYQMDCPDPTSALVPMGPPSHHHKGPIRRPCGRPAGSKNKPKQPIIIARESPGSLRAHAMEVGSGCDIFECITGFARRRQKGVCILSGSGCVANVALRQPNAGASGGGGGGGAILTLNGRFEILSLVGSFFIGPPGPSALTGLTVYLAGAQGQVVGGGVVGPLIASGPVVIMAATFMNVSVERLPMVVMEEEEELDNCDIYKQQPCRLRPMQGALYGMPTRVGFPLPEIYGWIPGNQIAKS